MLTFVIASSLSCSGRIPCWSILCPTHSISFFALFWVYSIASLFQFFHCLPYFHFVFFDTSFADYNDIVQPCRVFVFECPVYPFLKNCWYICQSIESFQETVVSSDVSSCYGKYTEVFCVFVQFDLPKFVISPSFPSDIFLDIREISFSMFDIWAFLFIVTWLSFLESRAIFIDLSFSL